MRITVTTGQLCDVAIKLVGHQATDAAGLYARDEGTTREAPVDVETSYNPCTKQKHQNSYHPHTAVD
jgi:hypothetical protein